MRIYQRDLYRKNWRLSLIKFYQLLLHVWRSVWRIFLWSLGRTKNKIANVEPMYERPRVNVNLNELQLLCFSWTSTFA